jgi:hypothetical protein
MCCCWGVFHELDEVHVAPCDRDGDAIDAHRREGYACWCRPQPDPHDPRVIIHNHRSRGLH